MVDLEWTTSGQQHRSRDVRLWFSSTEIGHLGFVVLSDSDLSRSIFDALDEALPNDDCELVWRVEVDDGWGRAHFVTVWSGSAVMPAARSARSFMLSWPG